MSDLTPEIEAEIEAEIERALLNASLSDNETRHAFELTVAAMQAVGADGLVEECRRTLPDELRSLTWDALSEHDWDRLRDWIAASCERLQEYLIVHGIPRIQLSPHLLTCGCVRWMTLEARSR